MTATARTTRMSDGAWALVVLWFVSLNVLDLGLTLHLIDKGAVEMNPIMAALLDAGWTRAALFKTAMTVGVALGLWLGRRHLLVRRTGIAFVVLFIGLIGYQMIDLWAAG